MTARVSPSERIRAEIDALTAGLRAGQPVGDLTLRTTAGEMTLKPPKLPGTEVAFAGRC